MFTIGCAWVRMRPYPPKSSDLVRMWVGVFKPNVADWMSPDAGDPELLRKGAGRIVRLKQCLNMRYASFGSPVGIQEPKEAVDLIAGVWYGSCDQPAQSAVFTDHVQFLFPNLDTLEVAKRCAWICQYMMPDVYSWWFPQNQRNYQVDFVQVQGEGVVVRPTRTGRKIIRKSGGS